MFYMYLLIGGALVAGVGITIYEYRTKRTLLKHDLNQQPRPDAHTHAATVQAQDATVHRIAGFDR